MKVEADRIDITRAEVELKEAIAYSNLHWTDRLSDEAGMKGVKDGGRGVAFHSFSRERLGKDEREQIQEE